jgi:hypothetical protein
MSSTTTETQAKTNPEGPSRLHSILNRATKNPRWLVMEAFSRFSVVRSTVRLIHRSPTTSCYDLSKSQFTNVEVEHFVASLQRDGFCGGLRLPSGVIEEIMNFALQATCYGNANPRYGFLYANKSAAQLASKLTFSQATYLFLDNLIPMLESVVHDPLLLAIAARYLHAAPVMTGSRLWWVFATPPELYNASVTTSFFHYDKDDYAAVRFFFYLTAVDDNHGAHVVVRGSHKKKRLSQLISLGERSDEEIIRAYGRDNLVKIFGEPGDGFAEDPYCFHKATRPVAGDRLMLEIKYAVRDYKIFPAPDPSTRVDLLRQNAPSAPGPDA